MAEHLENEWLKRETMRLTLTELNPPGWEARVAELMAHPDMREQAKKALAPMIEAVEDKAILIELGILPAENSPTGKPN